MQTQFLSRLPPPSPWLANLAFYEGAGWRPRPHKLSGRPLSILEKEQEQAGIDAYIGT